MPSSLTRVISLILGFSPRLPVSVCGTGIFFLPSSFSRQCGFDSFHTYFLSPSRLSLKGKRTSLSPQPKRLDALYHQRAQPILLCHCIAFHNQYRNINLLSIAYDHPVLGLGPDLPWEDEPSPGNLRLSMLKILTSVSLLMPAFSLLCSPPLLSVWLLSAHDAPLPIQTDPIASAAGFSPGHFRRKTTRLVSYYALFK